MSAPGNLRLPFEAESVSLDERIDARDRAARERAVDPRHNVVLEASAGTGKTRVLVDRYVNLLRAGVAPPNILAMTFTRKAAAEMRERIVATLQAAAERGEIAPARWRELRDRMGEIAIGTIDAFCLSLLREFPLEADLDPGFTVADDTEVPRLMDEALDRALRVCRAAARDDEHVALVFAQLGDGRARAGLSALLHRRLVAPAVLERYLSRGPRDLSVGRAVRDGAAALLDLFGSMPGGLTGFLEAGPPEPAFLVMGRSLLTLQEAAGTLAPLDPAALTTAFARVREHFLTQDAQPRQRLPYTKAMFASPGDWQFHKTQLLAHGPAVARTLAGYRRDLNVLVSRGVWRMFRIAEAEYRRTLDAHAVVDFPDLLGRTLDLLRHMEEFAQSRYRLESRYHHVLVDELQDTSRAQWELIALLVQAWGQGAGLAHTGPLPPSIFVVGDRKQSIYGFRDAEVSVLVEARRYLEALRPEGDVRRSISRSFRSVPALLAFVNDVCHDMEKAAERSDAFVYGEEDRFPLAGQAVDLDEPVLGLIAAGGPEACAGMAAAEIARLLAAGTPVRDRGTGMARAVRAGDVAILFRTRESHREFERALERRGIPSYVYKGLGFFDSDEVKDILSLISYLADPLSELRAAAWLRSGFVRLSDEGLRRLAPALAEALHPGERQAASPLDAGDARAIATARAAAARWRGLVDRMPPAELIDLVLHESAYLVEIRGPRFQQARENIKKCRALIRRIQNRGYATLPRLAAHLDRLAVGEEANAAVDAVDAVNLMTVHAAKGLEFPIVFVMNLTRGTGSRRDPIRVAADLSDEATSVRVGDFQTESDEDEAAKDREETKRLLYVALTRARDRLYLGAALEDAHARPRRGSLGEVLPATLVEQLSAALAGSRNPDGAVARWYAASGTAHPLRVCPAAIEPAQSVAMNGDGTKDSEQADFLPLEDRGHIRRTPRGAAGSAGQEAPADAGGAPSDRVVGTLVHRLLQRFGLDADAAPAVLQDRLSGLLQPEETVDLADRPATIERAERLYRAVARRADIAELYRSARVLHEVPFTMIDDGLVVRGTIDCLVWDAERVVVVEFKTGRRRPEHREQAQLYRRAAARIFPELSAEARLVYADGIEGALIVGRRTQN